MMTAEERGADSIRSDRLDGKEEVGEEGRDPPNRNRRTSERASERTTGERPNDPRGEKR